LTIVSHGIQTFSLTLGHSFGRNLSFKSPNGEYQSFFTFTFQDIFNTLKKHNFHNFYYLHFSRKDLGHCKISIPKVGKSLGNVGTHFFTLVRECLILGIFTQLIPPLINKP
jgi:hypothetical protein